MERKSTGIPLLDDFIDSHLSQTLINFVDAHGKSYLKILQGVRKMVKKLVLVRDKIFETLSSLYELDKEVEFFTHCPFNKEDFENVKKHCLKMKEENVFSDKILWHIDGGEVEQPYCSDIELKK